MTTVLQSSSARLNSLLFGIVLILASSLTHLPREFGDAKRWLELAPDEIELRVAVLLALLAKTLLAVLLASVVIAIASRWLSPRRVRMIALLLSAGLLGFLAADLDLKGATGNSLLEYLPYLFDPKTFVWAGAGFDPIPGLLRVAGHVVLGLGPAFGLALLVERWVQAEASGGLRARKILAGIASLIVVSLGAAIVFEDRSQAPGTFAQLRDRLPWFWGSVSRGETTTGTSASDRLQSQAQRLFETRWVEYSREGVMRDASIPLSDSPKKGPDILVVAIESLQRAAFDHETMPELWSWARRGVRFDAHSATSNASHYGLFALLYGRSPIHYFETLEAGEPPLLPESLSAQGYDNHYLTCSDIAWRGMDRYLGPAHFRVESLRRTSIVDCDAALVNRVSALLEESARPPRFILAFMMSTHFGYHHDYPDGEEPFQPSMGPPNAIELDAERDRDGLMNRYRNSVHSVDALLGPLLSELDSENTIVVVTGDHGESIFDDGTIAHSSLLSDAQTGVPLVLGGPSVEKGQVHRLPTDHADLFSILTHQLAVPSEAATQFGSASVLGNETRAFVALVQAKAQASAGEHVVLASPSLRFSFRIDRARRTIRAMGKIRPDGRLSRAKITESEVDLALEWLDVYLRS